MNEEPKRLTQAFWAEKTPCGEMWVGRYRDETAPDGVRNTVSCGDHDTAILYARKEQEKSLCTGYTRPTT
jgi:hypothetical protein